MPEEVEKRPTQPPGQAERGDSEEVPGSERARAAELIAEVMQYRPELIAEVMQFSGPLPPPQVLKAYDAIIPGAAKEMHGLALAKARHDMEMERDAMRAQTQEEQAARAQFKRGQYLAFLLALVLIGCGSAGIYTHHDWAGAAMVVGTLAALVLAFLWGRKASGSAEQQDEDEAEGNPPQS
jgi:uncharacterized membrane protein